MFIQHKPTGTSPQRSLDAQDVRGWYTKPQKETWHGLKYGILANTFCSDLPQKRWFEIKMATHLRNPCAALVRAPVQTSHKPVEEKLDFLIPWGLGLNSHFKRIQDERTPLANFRAGYFISVIDSNWEEERGIEEKKKKTSWSLL